VWAWLIGIIAVGFLLIALIVGSVSHRPVDAGIYASTDCGSALLPNFVSTYDRGGCDAAMAAARYLTIGLSAAATLLATVGALKSSARDPRSEAARRSFLAIEIAAALMFTWTLAAWGLSQLAAYEPG